jgi:putative hemolysin
MWTINADLGRKIIALTSRSPYYPNEPKRENGPLDETLGRLGSLEVRLARGKGELRKAQRLRYEVFYQEGGALPSARVAFTRRDADRFDKYCDHLIVIDHDARTKRGKVKPRVVGAYRLLRDEAALKAGGFYSESEYDIAPFLERHRGKRILELGRSCVLESHRGKRAIELLWRGLLAYLRHYQIDAVIGCASFKGADPLAHAQALSYLAHHASAEDEWRVSARSERYADMAILPKEAVDMREGQEALSPLIKGYLRLGAKIGDGAVVDHKFNTTDVFVVMQVAAMSTRYTDRFGSTEKPRRAA